LRFALSSELSAINGIAGSYAERLPVFHLVGMPNQSTQEARALVHHTLGNGAYEFFYQMTEPAVCARAIITPQMRGQSRFGSAWVSAGTISRISTLGMIFRPK
jgi:TPP-dependent 2-oxoacid decarboxylase